MSLNISIMNADELLRYARPESPLEVALYEALALAMKDKGQEFDDLTDELNELNERIDNLENQLEEAEDKIEELKDELFVLKDEADNARAA